MLRAIVFDFDGVIANSEPLHFRGYRDTVAAEGVVLTEKAYYSQYLGYDDVGAFERIGLDQGIVWTRSQIDGLVARKAIRLEELERDISVLFPGAADAIHRAAAAMPIAIASGARGAEIRRLLEHEQLIDRFAAIVAAEDTAVSKPAPDPYLRAIALLAESIGGHLAAGDCVAIEDSHWGLQSAKAAGMRTVAVTNTYPAAVLAKSADLVIGSLESLDISALMQLAI